MAGKSLLYPKEARLKQNVSVYTSLRGRPTSF